MPAVMLERGVEGGVGGGEGRERLLRQPLLMELLVSSDSVFGFSSRVEGGGGGRGVRGLRGLRGGRRVSRMGGGGSGGLRDPSRCDGRGSGDGGWQLGEDTLLAVGIVGGCWRIRSAACC